MQSVKLFEPTYRVKFGLVQVNVTIEFADRTTFTPRTLSANGGKKKDWRI
jgi:hypothetical protein